MKRFLVLLLVALFAIGLTGCGTKDAAETDKVPADVKEAEMQDTTRLDSLAEAATEAVEGAVEEAADEAKEVVDDAAEAVKDAAGGN